MPDTRRPGADAVSAPQTNQQGSVSSRIREKVRTRRRKRDASEHSALGEKLIAGVPARIMRPRLVFISCLFAILAFGLLMVYSASAVEALKEYGSATHFLVRQGIFIGLGLGLMAVISFAVPLQFMRSGVMWVVWLGTLALLLAVLLVGEERGGATRWIVIAGQQFQPSEFVKPVVIVTAAKIFHEYYEMEALDTATFLLMLGACVAGPLLLIILEPDLGSCLIIAGTVFAMCYFAGFSYKVIGAVLVVGVLATIVFIVSADYRMARMASDPWEDPYDTGYQAVLAIMAFASGGLFGRGIGNSTMKYNYLPEAHNDYILAIIGEELGFFGMLIFFAVYALMVVAIFKIAEQSPTVQGRLIAYGCGVIIFLQFLVNALGILGVTPMTGKTMPFISYGGSSMIAMLAVAGLVMRVSLESNPVTVHDVRRSHMSVVGEGRAAAEGYPVDAYAAPAVRIEGSTAGPARRRSERNSAFTVVDGSAGASYPAGRAERPAPSTRFGSTARGFGRSQAPAGGYERINLDYDPAERLRTRDRDRNPGPRGGGQRGRSRYDR